MVGRPDPTGAGAGSSARASQRTQGMSKAVHNPIHWTSAAISPFRRWLIELQRIGQVAHGGLFPGGHGLVTQFQAIELFQVEDPGH